MAIITLNFNHTINVSVQVGDVGYYVPTFPVGNPQQSALNPNWTYGPNFESTTTPHWTRDRESVITLGTIIAVTLTSITCDMPDALIAQYGPPTTMDFIMFSKDNKANLSSILGYYAEVKFTNNSPTEAELFSVGTEIFESSK